MNLFYFLHLAVFLFMLQFLVLGYSSRMREVWAFIFTVLVNVFGVRSKLPLSCFLTSFFFGLTALGCFYGHLSWNIGLCRMFEFTLAWGVLAWLSTFMILVTQESSSVVFGLYGEGFGMTMYSIWGKLSSVFMRPFALAVRLTVNLTVGHQIMVVWIKFFVPGSNAFNLLGFLGTQSGLVVLVFYEFCVFILQSFIFTRLLSIYLEEC